MIIIDLDKCYGCSKCRKAEPGIYAVIEKGIRIAVCRHCVNPPCVSACPVEALEKKEDSDLRRYVMKCVSCKQCSAACPVGANPPAILKYKTYAGYKINFEKCMKICSQDAIAETPELPAGAVIIEEGIAGKALKWK